MNIKIIIVILWGILIPTVYGQANTIDTLNNKNNMKKVVTEYYKQLYSSSYTAAISQNLSPQYVEHQETANFSVAGLTKFIQKRLTKYPDLKITIHRVIEQGNFIFMHVEEKINSNLTYVHGELFKLKDSKIVEHWAAIQKHPKKLKSGRKMYDGQGVDYSKNTGLKYTEITKQSYIDAFTLPVKEAVDAIDKTTTDRYWQHNPSVVDGKAAFQNAPKLLAKIAKVGIKTTLNIKMTISEGDYVVTFAHFHLPLIAGNQVLFDIFRVADDGRKDEHWDIGQKFKKKNMMKVF